MLYCNFTMCLCIAPLSLKVFRPQIVRPTLPGKQICHLFRSNVITWFCHIASVYTFILSRVTSVVALEKWDILSLRPPRPTYQGQAKFSHNTSKQPLQIKEYLRILSNFNRTNREYFMPQNRKVNSRFHSDTKLPLVMWCPLANRIVTS